MTVRTPHASVASVYVPNGGKDFPAKMQFLTALDAFAADSRADALPLVICGDLNVARTDADVHPKERKPRATGQLPEERELLERSSATASSMSVARSIRITINFSRGGRPGATCASATSAGASTTSWRASPSMRASAALKLSASLAPAITRRCWLSSRFRSGSGSGWGSQSS